MLCGRRSIFFGVPVLLQSASGGSSAASLTELWHPWHEALGIQLSISPVRAADLDKQLIAVS